MSLQPQKLPEVPEETARIAKILFPKGNKYMWLRDELEVIHQDEQFMELYPKNGQLAEQPWKLAIMSIIQYMENYTDLHAAEALKTRIDLKYALSLKLTDPGFDFSVNDMLNVLVLKAPYRKEYELSIFVVPATLVLRKHTFNTSLLLLQ